MPEVCDKCKREVEFVVDYPGYLLCQDCKKKYPFGENQKFSYFENGISNVIPKKDITIKEFLELIKQDNPLIENIRSQQDKEEKDKLKRNLSYVTFGGTFEKRSKKALKQASGYACFDFDSLNDLEGLKEKLSKNKYTHLVFISPSGKGLKMIVKIPGVKSDEEYKEYWESIAQHYDIEESDESNKDISRACFLSVDKSPYFNENSEVYTDKADLSETENHIIEKKQTPAKNDNGSGESSELIDKLKNNISMPEILSHFGVDTSKNPTNCIFHSCSQRCLSFNSELSHCFDTDCSPDNSWNIFSFVQKAKGLNSAETIKWLCEFAGMEEEYEESKKKYLENQKEPMGWALSINIRKYAEKRAFTKCPVCNVGFEFNERLGFFKCPECEAKGGLKKFTKLYLIHKNKLKQTAK